MYGPQAISEIALGIRLLPRIPAESIIMADRGFGIFYFAQAVCAANLQLVARLTRPRFQALKRKATSIGAGRWELCWRPSAWDRKRHPDLPADANVFVHLHELEVVDEKGEPLTLWLVTTLTDVEADREVWSQLYRCRWRGENDIRDVKTALKMEELRGRSEPMLRKELALGIAAYNLVVQIRRLAAKQAGVEPRRLGFTRTWHVVQIFLLRAANYTAEEYADRFEMALRLAGQQKLPNRPDRHFPRTKLSNAAKYPTPPRKKQERPPM